MRETIPEKGLQARREKTDPGPVRDDFLQYLAHKSERRRIGVRHKLRYGFDSYERHFVAANFISFMGYRRIIDVGGLPKRIAGLKSGREVDVVTANLSEPADVVYEGGRLPLDDSSFDGAVCLDVLEHVPPDQRPGFINEILRVSAGPALLSVPYRSDVHEDSERELQKLHEQAIGEPHAFLAEHIKHGLANEKDLQAYLSSPGLGLCMRCSCFFTGNIDDAARPLRKSLHYKRQGRLSYLFHLPYLAWSRGRPLGRVECHVTPSEHTNRLYAIVSR